MRSILSMTVAAIGILCLGLTSATAQAAPPEPWTEQVAWQLAVITRALADYGFTLSDADGGLVRTNGRFVRETILHTDVEYAFAIACDDDCGYATLQVYDKNGRIVGRRVGNQPIVMVTPRQTGPFQLKATLDDCATHVCEVAVALFER
jgi:hypothetical protein